MPADDHTPHPSGDGQIGTLEAHRLSVRDEARRRLGITGDDEEAAPLRHVLRQHRVGLYPLLAVGFLALGDQFQALAFGILTPDISRALGLNFAAVGALYTLRALATPLAPLAFAAMTQTRPRRALLCILTGIGWSLITLSTGLVTSMIGLALLLVLEGLVSGSVAALHQPLLMDAYPPAVRVRILAGYRAFQASAGLVAPLLIFVCVAVFNLTWRGVFIALGSVSMLFALLALGLRDPGFGRWDTERIRGAVSDADAPRPAVAADRVELRFFEIVRRLLLIPTFRRLAFGFMVFGMLLIPFFIMMAFYLDERWGLDAGQRGLFSAGMAAVGIVALMAFGRRGESLFQQDPARVVSLAGTILAAAVIAILGAALLPSFVLVVAAFAVAHALIALLTPLLSVVQLSIVESSWRPHTGALIGIFMAAGSLAGLLMLSGVEQRFGIAGALVALMIPGVSGALIIRSAKDLVNDDLNRMIDEVVESEAVRNIIDRGGHLPLLSCRNINFAYGQLQVLFGVDFTVDEGEIVALLGTNGSGKSTLLKVISGIGLPMAGTVRLRGRDITYLDAERRVRMGLVQVPGGQATFGRMSVIDNLRLNGYALGKDRKAVDGAIERCLDIFPRLQERRMSPASTLSGGEQQMLALSKALILKPQVLMIDELSLGLAPVVVGQLLDIVREINQQGTAVVLVEQSVNIALSIAAHAYFMEKGEIRFDGPSADLLQRDDLLRAVFLGGAGTGATS